MFDFILLPLLAGVCIALISGPLGSFIIWRRMAYFGDTLAHASLLGLVVGFVLHINLNLALLISCLLIALFLMTLQQKSRISADTLLGIIAHTSLSLALVALSLVEPLRVDLTNYLFGDLLSITWQELAWVAAGSAVVMCVLARLWSPFLAITVNEDLAQINGYPVARLKLTLLLLIATVIALAMKFVGALIITSLMIIPAAAAKRFAKSPEQMAIFASLLGVFAVMCGIAFSWLADTPTGPSIVVCAAILFFLSLLRMEKSG
ncbi:MAG: zinc ABC transporter permease subunit ZnuB [Vibrionaceae bacterium]